MNILTIIMITIGIILVICFAIFVDNVSVATLMPPQECPDCHNKMKIIKSNIYTGQALYECSKCHKRVSYHYDEDELIRENDGFTCSLNHKKSEKR